jgi:hypothetical protein
VGLDVAGEQGGGHGAVPTRREAGPAP